MSESHEPVLVVQWGDLGSSAPDVARIFEKVHRELGGSGSVAQLTCPSPKIQFHVINGDRRPDDFLKELCELVKAVRRNLQILYIAAHGNESGIAPKPNPTESLSCDVLATGLEAAVANFGVNKTLVMGWCGARGPDAALAEALAADGRRHFECLAGFTDYAGATELMAEVVLAALAGFDSPGKPMGNLVVEQLNRKQPPPGVVVYQRPREADAYMEQIWPQQQ